MKSALFLLALAGCSSLAAAQDAPAGGSAPAAAPATAPGAEPALQPPAAAHGRVLALSMGKPISEADLQPDDRLIKLNKTSLDEKAYADWFRRAQVLRLTELIFVPLLSEYSREKGIEATAAEIDEFITRSNKAEAEAEADFVRQKAEIEAELRNTNLAPSDRTHLESQLGTLNTILESKASMEERARREFGDNYKARMREIDEGVARQMIVAWKLNKSLFDQYGGRVAFQQAGPEPLDAYAAFLADRKKAGAFGIYDPAIESAFWDYFQNDSMHQFYSAEESHDVMKTPWWKLELPAKAN